ncbi:hypothetical protein BSF43_38860 [Pseudomonas ogarae]|nr:hypothetical protein BSF43_38860 [Pseudomonas ogarae]
MAVYQSTSMWLTCRYREQARSHRELHRTNKNAPIISDRSVFYGRYRSQAAIDTLSLFIALFSSWRIRSADTLYFCARSCSVAFSSASQRW